MAKVALLVGVSQYQPGLQALPSAAQDVVAMQRVLEHPEMGGFNEVKILTNPLTKELEIAIYDLFAERHSEDVVLFYFSGHGVKDEHRNLYLTTPQTRKSSKGIVVTPTAVAASYLQTQMSRSLCQRQ
ncbi:MAG: caspase family protein, partial [Merismopedia sp. SIO2A8]|nr:caspase family protein [Merismopedia sp. SIO2A8]